MSEREKMALTALLEREELAEKKARIYARLLTDTQTVQKITQIAENHLKRRVALQGFLGIKAQDESGELQEKGEEENA